MTELERIMLDQIERCENPYYWGPWPMWAAKNLALDVKQDNFVDVTMIHHREGGSMNDLSLWEQAMLNTHPEETAYKSAVGVIFATPAPSACGISFQTGSVIPVYTSRLPSAADKLESARRFLDERKPFHPEWTVKKA